MRINRKFERQLVLSENDNIRIDLGRTNQENTSPDGAKTGTIKQKIIPVLIIVIGLCITTYPWFSNWMYDHGVESTVGSYERDVEETDQETLDALLKEAIEYNEQLVESKVALTDPFIMTDDEDMNITYESVLDLNGTGIMCFIDIPKIDVYLPVYHGTSEEVLEKGAGHLENTSVPVGGESTHAVISAHTGINSSKMFSDLTEMEKGDLFFIHVLGETLAYRVCDIQIVLPEETGPLVIQKGKDLMTLVTCTPYGVNSHRLLVMGKRTEYTEEVLEEAGLETMDEGSQWMKAYKKAILIGLCLVAILFAVIKTVEKAKKRKEALN